MNKLLPLLVLCAIAAQSYAQVAGNIGYGQQNGRGGVEQEERSKRAVPFDDLPPNESSMFLEASVLMNVKADNYVAAFGISEEAKTIAECQQKMDSTIHEFKLGLRQMGVSPNDIFVDFIAQNKTYGYEPDGEVAREKLVGFELKKNVSIHYTNKALIDKLVACAARSQVFDLIKVDYVVKDPTPIQDRVMAAAAGVLKMKVARYKKLLGIKLVAPQVYADKPSAYFPSELYDSYTAAESQDIEGDFYRRKYIVVGARKSHTFYFNPLSGKLFDKVINPVVLEPVVQYSIYLKVKYRIGKA